MYTLIPLILISLSSIVIISIAIKKFPMLANLDMENIPAEKEAKFKEQIISNRLKRNLSQTSSFLAGIFKPLGDRLGGFFKSIHDRLAALEEKYRKEPIIEDLDADSRMERLFNETNDLIKAEEYNEAEKKLIEIIGIDNKNIKAFKLLGGLYSDRKNYEEARETYEYILKIKEDDEAFNELKKMTGGEEVSAGSVNHFRSQIYFDLSSVYRSLDNIDQALVNVKKALEIEPNNPRYLDTILEISIIKKDKVLAKESYKKLKEVNPENQKLAEIKEEISEI